jgi:YqaJ-like viral recombinase domain
MKIIGCVQGSDEWHRARLGIPTASQFSNIITPTGMPVKAERRRKYMFRLICERMLQQSLDDERGDRLYWARRGQTVEPQARAAFETFINFAVEQTGCITDDKGRYAASPDGILKTGTSREGLEMKCPSPWITMGYLLDGPGDDFTPQVQGNMFVGEFEAMHLWIWHPSMPPKHVITLRDDDYMDRLGTALHDFCGELDEETHRARTLGVYKVAEHLRITGEMMTELPGVFPWLS